MAAWTKNEGLLLALLLALAVLLTERRFSALLAFACIACGAPPVEWEAQRSVARPGGPALSLSADGTARPDTMAALATRVAPPQGPSCAGSLRVAGTRATLVGVWWAPRPDSGVRLLAARSSDGGRSWSAPAAVDTSDAGAGGCRRAPAAIAADSASGYVHVTYALQAAEGPGRVEVSTRCMSQGG